KRLSLDFRFRTGSAELDSRAQRDIDRLIAFLGTIGSPKISLLGFADSDGSPTQNLSLAMQRAQKVDGELAARGLRTSRVAALGQEMPISSNETEAGREKNRRVEVWLEAPTGEP